MVDTCRNLRLPTCDDDIRVPDDATRERARGKQRGSSLASEKPIGRKGDGDKGGNGLGGGKLRELSDNPEIRAVLKLIEHHAREECRHSKIPGLAAGVVYDQELIWAKGFGYADAKKKTPVTPRTLFAIMSITKVFTATAMMQLRDAGKLSLDDPIQKHVPKFRLASRFSDPSPVTFRQVASHSSGIPNETNLGQWETLKFPSIETILGSLESAEAVLPPLTDINYTSLGPIMIGHSIERITGMSFKEYLSKNLLKPLGMKNTAFDLSANLKKLAATGYVSDKNGKLVPAPAIGGDLDAYAPMGLLWTSIEDIAKFISLQFRDLPAGGSQVLRGTSLREMRTPVLLDKDWKSGYGIGWNVEHVGDRTYVGHGGGGLGFTAGVTFVPNLRLGVAAFANCMAGTYGVRRFALDALIPVTEALQARQEGARTSEIPPEWERYRGKYSLMNAFEAEVNIINGRLTLIAPNSPPSSWAWLSPEGGEKFRVMGNLDDELNGEPAVFESDKSGRVTRLRIGAFPLDRI